MARCPRAEHQSLQREQLRVNAAHWSSLPDSRWLDHIDGNRTSIVLFDLLNRENGRNAQLARLYEREVERADIERQIVPSFLRRLNAVLQRGRLSVVLEITDAGGFDAISGGSRYPMQKMSDGEKAAVLLAAEVLTCRPMRSRYWTSPSGTCIDLFQRR
jgi:hypothetical protein